MQLSCDVPVAALYTHMVTACLCTETDRFKDHKQEAEVLLLFLFFLSLHVLFQQSIPVLSSVCLYAVFSGANIAPFCPFLGFGLSPTPGTTCRMSSVTATELSLECCLWAEGLERVPVVFGR